MTMSKISHEQKSPTIIKIKDLSDAGYETFKIMK